MLVIHTSKYFDYFTRVYYGNTDCGGVVYHASYLNFMEQARSEWLISLGYDQNMMHEQDILFAVSSAKLDFLRPACLYDLLQIESKIIKIGRVSIEFEQHVKNKEDSKLVFCRGYIKLVCVNEVIKPKVIPELLRRKIEDDS